VFDIVSTPVGVSKTYTERMVELEAAIKAVDDKHIRFVPITQINSYDELLVYEDEQLANGFEGVMIRDPNGPYKCGRSTEREGWLLKLKRFEDSEAEIIGFEELMHNNNVATIDELGHTKRSSAKAGKAPAGTLGKFKVRDVKSGVDFSCGTGVGLTQAKRQEIWDNRSKYMGKIIKYKSQTVGVKDAPRVPVYLGFRDPIDM
jgi:DNA ligase-1